MFLQAIPAAPAVQEKVFSFWSIMFHGNIFANTVMVTVLVLGIFSLYLFL
jgi:biopolymer transport protein ExbB